MKLDKSWVVEQKPEYSHCKRMWTKRIGPKGGPVFSLEEFDLRKYDGRSNIFELSLCGELDGGEWMKILVYGFNDPIDLSELNQLVERLHNFWEKF